MVLAWLTPNGCNPPAVGPAFKDLCKSPSLSCLQTTAVYSAFTDPFSAPLFHILLCSCLFLLFNGNSNFRYRAHGLNYSICPPGPITSASIKVRSSDIFIGLILSFPNVRIKVISSLQYSLHSHFSASNCQGLKL